MHCDLPGQGTSIHILNRYPSPCQPITGRRGFSKQAQSQEASILPVGTRQPLSLIYTLNYRLETADTDTRHPGTVPEDNTGTIDTLYLKTIDSIYTGLAGGVELCRT